MHVHATTPAQVDYNDYSTSGEHYFQDTQISVKLYSDSIVLTDLTNAMKPGKKCLQVKFAAPWGSTRCEVANLLMHCGYSFPALFTFLAKQGTPGNTEYSVEFLGMTGNVYIWERESIRTYSPFATLNPLKEAPKKWTLSHIIRALVNGQYKSLECRGRYSDDYAFDAAYNYFKGSTSAMYLVRELVSSPSGWWASDRDTTIAIGCYSFKSYDFILDLSGKPDVDEQCRRVCAENPNTVEVTESKGNSLIKTGSDSAAAQLADLYTAFTAAGRTVELDTEGPYTYLAIYNPTPKPVMAIAR